MTIEPLPLNYADVHSIRSVLPPDCFGRIGVTFDCDLPPQGFVVRISLTRGDAHTLQRLLEESAGSTKVPSAARTASEDVDPNAALRAQVFSLKNLFDELAEHAPRQRLLAATLRVVREHIRAVGSANISRPLHATFQQLLSAGLLRNRSMLLGPNGSLPLERVMVLELTPAAETVLQNADLDDALVAAAKALQA
jgi:hypothetical protein